MAISSVSLSGFAALRDSVERAQVAAEKVAQAGEPDGKSGIIEALLELQQAKEQTRASVQVVKAEDRMIGTLIDTVA